MNKLNETNAIELLLESIPEIKQLYNEEINWWDGEFPGLHNIFGNVLNPYLTKLLSEDENTELLKRIFDYIENMATSDDKYVHNVLDVTILEYLDDDKNIRETSLKYMGTNTKEISKKIDRRLGR